MNPKVIVNNTILIQCPATGVPVPSIVWLKEGQLLNEEAGHIEYQKKGMQLMVENAEVGDTGLYTCNAINEAGEAEIHFKLQVQGNNKGLEIYAKEFIKISVNTLVYIYLKFKKCFLTTHKPINRT